MSLRHCILAAARRGVINANEARLWQGRYDEYIRTPFNRFVGPDLRMCHPQTLAQSALEFERMQ